MKQKDKDWLAQRLASKKYHKAVMMAVLVISIAWTIHSVYSIQEIWQLTAVCADLAVMNDIAKACNSLGFGSIFNIVLSLLFLYLFLVILFLALVLEKKYINYILTIKNE